MSQGLSTYVAFIDLEKAFDFIDRKLLLYRLLSYDVNGKFYRVIKHVSNMYQNLFTGWFEVLSGVRQGDSLSPSMFGLFINDLADHIKHLNKGIQVGNDTVSILLYADDMVFLAETEDNLQEMLHGLHEWTNKWRMSVNISK